MTRKGLSRVGGAGAIGRRRGRLGDVRPAPERFDDGFTLLELVVAITLVAIVAVGFSFSVGLGFKTIAVARQRQTASELTSARLEHLRNIPYDQVALSTTVTHSEDDTNPDWFISADGVTYDVTGTGDFEELIVDPVDGLVLHLEDPVEVGSTVMEIYQYATWVDDPTITGTQDYKRVSVVIRYKTPALGGVNKIVRSSSLFTPGDITIDAAATTTTTAAAATTTTTTVPATTTTTVPAGPCAGDTTAPTGSFSIGATGEAETGYTAGTNVTLQMSLTDACEPILTNFSNDGVTYGADVAYSAESPTLSWSLSAGDGTKTISGKARDGVNNEASLASQTVVLDTTLPTVPGTLLRTVSCAGSNRTVTLSWAASVDTNLRAYRVYRSTDGATWSSLGTTASTSYADTHGKTLDTVRFYVVAYDKAGNTSSATNTVSLAKNQCS